MTTLRLTVDLPERFAREAQAAGLLTPEGIKQLLQEAMRRKAGEALIAAAKQASNSGADEPDMDELVADVKAARAARKKKRAS